MRFRRLHKTYAALVGYFWLPCPTCGQEFGGHEWTDDGVHSSSVTDPRNPNLGKAICPDCTKTGLGDY